MAVSRSRGFLDTETFRTVVCYTPLISIDLIVKNNLNQVLVGRRVNRPAQGFWFVPGGRVQKDEALSDAFSRLAKAELGMAMKIEESKFIGVFEHFYPDNFSGSEFSTHYVVLGYEIVLGQEQLSYIPMAQHDSYMWFTLEKLVASESVHPNTKLYFCTGSN